MPAERTPSAEPSEFEEQRRFFAYLEIYARKFPELAFCNGSLNGVRLQMGQAIKCKTVGMRSGFPDIFLPARRGRHAGLFIELKRRHLGSLEPEQRVWRDYLEAAGYRWHVCRGYEQALDAVLAYVRQPADPGLIRQAGAMAKALAEIIATRRVKQRERRKRKGEPDETRTPGSGAG